MQPWDDETDMAKLEESVRSIEADGLLWGASKLVAVGYGIKKLQIRFARFSLVMAAFVEPMRFAAVLLRTTRLGRTSLRSPSRRLRTTCSRWMLLPSTRSRPVVFVD